MGRSVNKFRFCLFLFFTCRLTASNAEKESSFTYICVAVAVLLWAGVYEMFWKSDSIIGATVNRGIGKWNRNLESESGKGKRKGKGRQVFMRMRD